MIPFFVEKILTVVKRKKKAKKTKRTFETYVPPPNYRSGYVKNYPDGMWHTAENLDQFQFERFKRQYQLQQYSTSPLYLRNIDHQKICERHHQLETLDGSEYYLCQHGVKVK